MSQNLSFAAVVIGPYRVKEGKGWNLGLILSVEFFKMELYNINNLVKNANN